LDCFLVGNLDFDQNFLVDNSLEKSGVGSLALVGLLEVGPAYRLVDDSRYKFLVLIYYNLVQIYTVSDLLSYYINNISL
jgi:hypothetical protein